VVATQVFIAAVGLYVALAAATDLRMRRIPNWLTVPAAVSGLIYHCLTPTGWGLWVSLAGFGVGVALLLLPWLAGGGGMGDVKLLAALGAWLGPKCLVIALGLSALIAALTALAMLLLSPKRCPAAAAGGLRPRIPRPADRSHLRRRTRGLPFAVPMAAGTWLVLAWLAIRGGL
jgi:prepilin peptidase CpaA